MIERFDLNGSWEFRAIPDNKKAGAEKEDVRQWMPATVPGTVHTDLICAGKIPDPFYRMNELDVQWVDSACWDYRREFTIDKRLIAHDAVYLVAEGLDTYAQIKLNGKIVGEPSNMFVEHRFEVKRILKAGNNVLEIVFDSPTLRMKQLEGRYGALKVSHVPYGVYARVYARKAQYSFGWDWGPKLATAGIWRSIYLEAFSNCRIKSVFARATNISKNRSDVQVEVDLERKGHAPTVLNVELTGEGFEFRKSFNVTNARKSVTVKIPNPYLWWPNGYGDQSMYQVKASVVSRGFECDTKTSSFGIRTIRLLQKADSDGKSFIFEINGVKIFCKGADWIPSDNFVPRIPTSTYERLLTMARDAHMTMIRVWGGGIYEQDIFYELCDRFGLMVWQDFMFACGEYPENDWFLRLVRDEAEKAVTRLRNHPSIVLWCGNNECEWNFYKENPGKNPDDMRGAPIFRDLLPSVCRSLDGTRPYWRSSPFGVGFPNDESNGNHHQWDMWGLWKDYKDYEQDFARFITEFGFQAPASLRTMESVTAASDRHPQSKVLEHHNKLPEGSERLYRFMASHFLVASNFDDFVFKAQLVQAEALKTATEHWRRRKFKTAGSMFWQLNDCWPVTSWSVIDSGLRPKAAYYFAKKFYAPLLVSFRQTRDALELWGTNDLLLPLNGDLRVILRSFEGAESWTRLKPVIIPANSSRLLMRVPNADFVGADSSQNYLHAQLQVPGKDVSENRYFLSEPKHMRPQPSALTTELVKLDDSLYELSISSKTLVKNARIDFEGEDLVLQDNFFDVDPGVTKRMRITTEMPLEQLQKKLKIRSLWG